MAGVCSNKSLTQPVASFTLFAVVTAALLPAPCIAKQVEKGELGIGNWELGREECNSCSPISDPKPLSAISLSQSKIQKVAANGVIPEGAYTLGAGDRIRLDIFAVPEYSGEYQVLVDGTLNLPIIGSLSVGGQTLAQVTALVTSRYSRYVRKPIVTVSLIAPRPLKVGVSGEVNRPGSYTISVSEGKQFPTLTQAIALAGGTTQAANIRQVRLSRRGANGTTLDLSGLLQSGSLNQDITLRDGDTVFIPTADTIRPDETRQLTTASFAAQTLAPLSIAVVGEVSRPGTYTIAPDTSVTTGTSSITLKPPTVTKALLVAGGITPSANIRQVKVRRPTRNGGADKEIDVDLWQLLQAGNINQDITLQDGDTILVPTISALNTAESAQLSAASFASQATQPLKIAVVGEVFRPGPYSVTATSTAGATATGTAGTGTSGGGGSPPTVTRAIQVAGGITPLADIRSIEVRRSPRNGVEQVIKVNLWQLLQGGDLTQDLILQDGDTISIPTATTIDTTEASTVAAASFSPNTITVNVVGEVQRAGPVQVPPNTPLNQALLAAGSFNTRARTQSVDLIRLNPNGTVTKRSINVKFENGINTADNPIVQNNDVIVVGRSTLASVSDTLGSVLAPVTGFFSFFNFLSIFRGR